MSFPFQPGTSTPQPVSVGSVTGICSICGAMTEYLPEGKWWACTSPTCGLTVRKPPATEPQPPTVACPNCGGKTVCIGDGKYACVDKKNHHCLVIGTPSDAPPSTATQPPDRRDDKELARRYKRMARNIARSLEARAFDDDDYDADRFGGNANCPHCGLPYSDHPQLLPSMLIVTCIGQLVKL